MAEAFAIWGAITGSFVAINIVKGWITELKQFMKEASEAAETLQRFFDECEACEADLDVWAEMWGIDRDVSRKYQLKLWGKAGSQAIVGHLVAIHRTNEDIRNILAQFLQQSGILVPLNARNAFEAGPALNQLAEVVSDSRLKLSQKQRDMTIKNTIKFVGSKSSDLTGKIAFVRAQITDMKVRARDAYAVKNQPRVPIAGDFIPRTALEETKKSILFQLAYETRLASKGLYQSCHAASKKTCSGKEPIEAIMLELDLIRKRKSDTSNVVSIEEIALQYQMLVTWHRKLLELLIEGPYKPEQSSKSYTLNEDGFYGACVKALSNEADNFQIISLADATWFRSLPARRRITGTISGSNPFRTNQQLKPISSLLYELDTSISGEPVERFPGSERITLAFKVVECGLFLSGTSWFSGLKSKYIQRSRNNFDEPRRFILQTQASTKEYEDNDFRQFAEQAFAIGVLLVEIGTGRLVDQIPPRVKGYGQGFSLYRAQTSPPSNPTMFSGTQIESLLTVALGTLYANSVKVCLQSKESWKRVASHTAEGRAEVYQKVLADYYSEVYIP